MRILDCKSAEDQAIAKDAPLITDYLCDDCRGHFEQVKAMLDAADIPYELDPRLVRGLDYYTKTAFEIQVATIGAQSAVCGGGRYDGLIKEIGGESTPGVGFALGMERVFSALAAQGSDIETEDQLDVYLVVAGSECSAAAFRLADQLRRAGLTCEMDYADKSFKAQMKAANRLQAAWAVIIGEDELRAAAATVKNMGDGSQESIPLERVKQYLLEK